MTSNLARKFLKNCFKNVNTSTEQFRSLGTYKAAVIKEVNKPLVIEEKKQQKLSKNDVRVKVNFCSVNSIDCMSFREPTRDLPFVPGYELSGKVLEVGKNVTTEQLIVGERVAALSLDKFGGFAEECVININDCFRIPTNVTIKDAAVLVCGHSTAVFTFSKLRPPKEDERIVITAGSAGLGLAAIDVAANMFKAKVIAVTDSEDRSEFMRDRGAFGTVKYTDKIKKDILSLTDKKGAEIVYDAVGDYLIDKIGSCVAAGGNIFHAVPVIYKSLPAPPPNTTLTVVSLHALRENDPELYRCMITDTLELAHEGIISAHVSATFKLAEVNEAIDYVESKKCTGKVVIKMET
ncbi:short-chain dehydrogenase/reductase [Holotrichia oblita]|uniref:Short-chain dehydrogenase/reductase n=2 Tax=Holotrichia oblita TaxID=644536 RepID=A0ACB9T517_HOLOL|nr:short-chain dehydrogenase/reductase [Holotrichia oblita]